MHVIRTLEIKETLMFLAERRRDKFGDDVLAILRGLRDLVSEEARYHKICYDRLYRLESNSEKIVSLF